MVENGLIKTKGRTKGTEYFVEPELLRKLDFKGKTSLKGIESHRLQELIRRDLEIYEDANLPEIQKRIGEEIPLRKIQHELKKMSETEQVQAIGKKRWTRYSLIKDKNK